MPFFKEQLTDIRSFIFDVDGVLADARVVLHPSGDLMRSMNTKDGYAIQEAVRAGYSVGIISGAKSESIRKRFKGLGVASVFLDSKNKLADFEQFLKEQNLESREVLYMGDDLPDIQAMKKAGLATCPADAVQEVQAISAYVSDYGGGAGCVRDVIEQVMRAQKKWGGAYE